VDDPAAKVLNAADKAKRAVDQLDREGYQPLYEEVFGL